MENKMPTTPTHVRYTRTTTDNSDTVRYDNGDTTLNWDVRELDNDEAKAKVEVGRRTENDSVRVTVNGSERNGLGGVEVRAEHRIDDDSRIGIESTDGDANHRMTGRYNGRIG